MALENPNTLDEFVETNPASQDQRSEGDDHIRNVKRVLKSAFPGLAGRAWRTVARSASGSLTSQHNMTVQNCAAGITLTPNAASSLGNGWICWVQAPTTGSVTINPSENINGGDTFQVPAGYVGMILSDGVEFWAFIMNRQVPADAPPFPTGTRMLFQQTTTPSGWTKEVGGVYNNAALRFTTGTAGTGGTENFTTVFAAGRNANSHALSISEMPSHSHSLGGSFSKNDQGNPQPSLSPVFMIQSGSTNVGNTGGSAGHVHGLPTFAVKYADVIIGIKD